MKKALYITDIRAEKLKHFLHDRNRVSLARFDQIQYCADDFTKNRLHHVPHIVGIQLTNCEEPVAQPRDRVVAQQPCEGQQMRLIG